MVGGAKKSLKSAAVLVMVLARLVGLVVVGRLVGLVGSM